MLRLIIILLFCYTVSAQNLLVNDSFDNDLNGWTQSGATPPLWDSFDNNESLNSGSAMLRNSETTANSDVEILSQCFSHTSRAYKYGASVFIPSGQAVTGSVVVRYWIRLNGTCEGGGQAVGGQEIDMMDGLDTWIDFDPNDINYSTLGGTIEFIIAVRKTEDSGEFIAFVDNSYLIPDNIFKNSFESL